MTTLPSSGELPEELVAEAREIATHAAGHVRNNADAEAVENIVADRVARALMAERERAATEAADTISALSAKVEELMRENARIRMVVSQVCVALGNGAHTDPDCTVEFMEFVPAEVGLVVGNLRTSLAERDRIIAEKDKALDDLLDLINVLTNPTYDNQTLRDARAARERRAS